MPVSSEPRSVAFARVRAICVDARGPGALVTVVGVVRAFIDIYGCEKEEVELDMPYYEDIKTVLTWIQQGIKAVLIWNQQGKRKMG